MSELASILPFFRCPLGFRWRLAFRGPWFPLAQCLSGAASQHDKSGQHLAFDDFIGYPLIYGENASIL